MCIEKTLTFFYRPVTIIRLLSEGTIEEGMYEIAQEKLHLERQITGNEGKYKRGTLDSLYLE